MDALPAARRWAQEWERGWHEHDVDAVAALYAPDAFFRTSPFREPHDPRRYAEWAFADEDAAEVRFGDPLLVAGDRAVVEWWTVSRSGAAETTLAGVSLLRFDEQGLVAEQRDYWHEQPGARRPHTGWGR